MSSFLIWCFGGAKVKSQYKVNPHDVTNVATGTSKSKVVKAFEAVLAKGAESRDVHRLERAVNEATSSGLLFHSPVLLREQARLHKWKIAQSTLQSLLRGQDVDALQSAVTVYKQLGLQNSENLLEAAAVALRIANQKELLDRCVTQSNIADLEAAIKGSEEMIQQTKEAVVLSQDVETARTLLKRLIDEQKLFAENPNLPTETLEKAISRGKVKLLRESLQRWERLKLDRKAPLYIHAKSVLEELLEIKQSKLVTNLEESVRQRNDEWSNQLLLKAKDAGIPQTHVSAIEDHVVRSLERSVTLVNDVIRALGAKHYEDLGQNVNALNETAHTMDGPNTHKKRMKSSDEMASKIAAIQTLVQDQNRTAARLTQNVIRPYRVCASAVGAVEVRMREVARQLLELAERHKDCHNVGVNNSRESFGCFREDCEVPLERPTMLNETQAFLTDSAEKISKVLGVARASVQSLENAANQNREKLKELTAARRSEIIGTGKPQNNPVHSENQEGGFAVLREAVAMLEVLNRHAALAGAEKTLGLFLGIQTSQQSQNDLEKVAANLEAALSALVSSTNTNAGNFPNLGNNRSTDESTKAEIASQKFNNLDRVLKCLTSLFPEKLFTNLKRVAGVKLAEIRISRLESNSIENSARYALHRAMLSDNETEIAKALNVTSLPRYDPAVEEAQAHIQNIREKKRTCIDDLRKAVTENRELAIEAGLSLSEKLYVSPVHAVVLQAKQKLGDLKFQNFRRENTKQDLALALDSENAKAIREAIARANSCQVLASDPLLHRAREFVVSHAEKCEEEAKLRHRNVEMAANVISFEQGKNSTGTFPSPESKLSMNLSERRRSGASSLAECLLAEITNIAEFRDIDTAHKIITKILHLSSGEEELSAPLVEDAEQVLREVDQKRATAKEIRKKLVSAVALGSFEELTASIALAESSTEVLEYLDSSNHDELLRAVADAREAFALLQERRKNEDEDLKLKQIAAARHQLKKALLTEETNSQPLREAVNAFRMVCLPDTDKSLLDEAKKRSGSPDKARKGMVTDGRTSNHPRKSGRKERRQMEGSRRSQTARTERPSTKPRQPLRPKTARTENNTSNSQRVLKPVAAWGTPRPMQNSLKTQNVGAVNGSDHKIVKTVRFETPNGEVRAKKRQQTNNPRPHSATDLLAKKSAPRKKQAWGAQDSKNIALLRKAEKNLQKVEMLEAKERLMRESNELWDKLKEGLTGKLKESIDSGDRADLWQALCEFERYFGDGELTNEEKLLLNTAKDLLRKRTASQYAESLKNALKQRDIETLEHLLYQIENESEDHLPDINRELFWGDVKRARDLVKQLSDLSKYRAAILNMSRQVVSEIHSFQSPPDVVKAAVLATFMILGENERKINDWPALHALMGKLGRLSVTRRVALCDPSSVSVTTARRGLFVLKDVSYEKIQKINKGASSFYCWANCMAHEVLARKGDGETRLPSKTPPKEKLLPKRIDIDFWSRLARPPDRRTAEQNFREKMSIRNRSSRAKSAVSIKASA